jgi:cytochrome c oxidase subunit 2
VNFELPVASNFAPDVDHIFIALLCLSVGILALVFGLIWYFGVTYRAGSKIDRGEILEKTWYFETAWTAGILLGFFGLFYWGALVYVREFHPPPDAMKIQVVGKQWMWKFEYPSGQREINTLYVPVGRPVQLEMTSEDVIHDLFIPAFRVKHDVLPGRWYTIWFIATKAGTYNLFCAQLCGADHSQMRGVVIALSPVDYARWLETSKMPDTLVSEGKALFTQLGCSGCHGGNGTVHAPSLAGLYDSPVPLSNGTTTIADEGYLRDSILFPKKQVVASYKPIMPSFRGKISQGDLQALIAYLKSLGAE